MADEGAANNIDTALHEGIVHIAVSTIAILVNKSWLHRSVKFDPESPGHQLCHKKRPCRRGRQGCGCLETPLLQCITNLCGCYWRWGWPVEAGHDIFVIPGKALVIPGKALVIPGKAHVIPGKALVIPSKAPVIPDKALVIPGLTGDLLQPGNLDN